MELWYTEEQTENVRFSMKVREHLFSKKSAFQQVDIFDTCEFGKVMAIDGLVMVTEKDEFIYHEMITHVAMAVNPEIRSVLVIGGGDGGTVREISRYGTIDKIDMVEIDELVVEAAVEHLPVTACRLKDPRVILFYEDGLEFVKGKKNLYDLIIVDSTDPIGPGEGLFTKTFYEDCYTALTEKGILVNQNESPFYEQNAREMIRANDKIKEIFPVAEAYQYHMPTYPSGHWLFGFASKGLHPLDDFNSERWEKLGIKTKYYNVELHRGAFALPNYVREMIGRG
jgi:spermidine synthase